jgi:hypothetical protein
MDALTIAALAALVLVGPPTLLTLAYMRGTR